MAHYQEQRAEHFVSKSSTPASDKDLWQTPQQIFDALNDEFDFSVDICASAENKLCNQFFSEDDSALIKQWIFVTNTTCFMNPPYSQTELFLERAAQQAKKHNLTVAALVNANTDTKWFANAVKSASEIRLITGRISFEKTGGIKVGGNTKGQCIIIWRGQCQTSCQITMISRDDLLIK